MSDVNAVVTVFRITENINSLATADVRVAAGLAEVGRREKAVTVSELNSIALRQMLSMSLTLLILSILNTISNSVSHSLRN